MDSIVAKLDELAECQAERDVMMLRYQERLEAAVPPELQALLQETVAKIRTCQEVVEAERETHLVAINDQINRLEAEVKEAVKTGGVSVKGKFLHAVFTRGRVTWDSKALEGYAAAHTEILPFRKEGEPSVSLRRVN